MGRPSFSTALFSADDGTMFTRRQPHRLHRLVLADAQVSVQVIRVALADAVALIEAAWARARRRADEERPGCPRGATSVGGRGEPFRAPHVGDL